MTAELRFGFGMLTAQRHPEEQRSDADIYADLVDLCAHAESAGFDSVWLSEHHFTDDGYMPSLLPVAAAIAARTQRISIGTGILLAPFYPPLRLAEDAATVDLLSAGRLILGIGAGYRDEEFSGFGVPKEGLGTSLDRTLDVLDGAWGAGTVQGVPDAAAVTVTPKPHRRSGPPIWIGARTPAGICRTARRADGLLAARVTPDELCAQATALLAAAKETGRNASELEVGVHCPVFAWPASAWERIEPFLHYSEWKYADMNRVPYGGRLGKHAAPPPLNDTIRAKLRANAIVGSPEEVAAGVRRYRDAALSAGVQKFHFIPRLYWPGMPQQMQREALDLFAERVVPLV